jgi:signal transduction histidine kinase
MEKFKYLLERFKKSPLNFKINFLFVLAVILPALLLNIVLTTISRRALSNSIFSQQQEIISRIAEKVDSQIARHQDLLLFNKDIAGLPRNEQNKAVRDILARGSSFSELALIDNKGRELWKYGRTGPVRNLVNRSKRREFTDAMAGRNYISDVNFSGQRLPYIIVSVPVNGRRGAMVAKLELDKLWQWISEVRISDSGHAFVVDSRGNLIAHRDTERVLAHSNFSSLPVVRDFMLGRVPSPGEWKQYRDEKGHEVVSMYLVLPRLGWAVITQIPSSEVYRPIAEMHKNIIFWTIFWTVIFLILGFRFVKYTIVGPISVLRAGAEQISAGKLDIKLDVQTGDELEELARNFEKMAVSLKELEDMRQDLIRMIIHDLKSPLSGLMGSLDYLDSGAIGEFNDDQKKIISLAKKSSENMLVMIQNLLDAAKMEEKKLELRKEPVNVSDFFAGRKAQFEHMVANESKTLAFEVQEGLPDVEMDRQMMERVLDNLISNAVHHTTSGGKIEVKAEMKGDSVELSVADNGAGIPPEYLDKIFEKFVQLDRKKAKLRTGSGLGLTFCKLAVESHGGKIRVESELNKGSRFVIALPAGARGA